MNTGLDFIEAILRLSHLADESPRDAEVRFTLSHCVGESLLSEVKPRFRRTGKARFVNVLTFWNEIELLKLHLS